MMGKRLRPAMTSDKKIGSLIAIVLLVALVCVSMNLLNGFTGLFSLG